MVASVEERWRQVIWAPFNWLGGQGEKHIHTHTLTHRIMALVGLQRRIICPGMREVKPRHLPPASPGNPEDTFSRPITGHMRAADPAVFSQAAGGAIWT